MLKKIFITILTACTMVLALPAQTTTKGTATIIDGTIEIDKIVHDFGDVIAGSGPLECSYTVTNLSDKPIVIYNVAVSCGCTEATWTREPIAKGKKGTISVVYNNEDGPYPFDKNITVYFSGIKKPLILKLRGTAHEKMVPLPERYPVHYGDLGLKETDIKAGNLSQGSQKSDAVMVANLGTSPLKLEFQNVTKGMTLSVSPNPIPAGETAKVRYIITSDRSKWGKNYYYATPLVNGKAQEQISVWTFTKEDFSSWTETQKSKAARPAYDTNTYNFNSVKEGSKVEATFTCKNEGKSDYVVYKADSDWALTDISQMGPLAPGKSASYKVTVDTSGMPEGENMVIVTLTTNAPSRPLVNLFIGGAVKK